MDRKEKDIKIINILCVLAMILIALPLLILGHFDYPSADDWSLGKLTSQAIKNGDGIIGVLKQAVNSVLLWREKGEPRFSAAFLGTLQPGIWGEHFYRITPWLMIGSLIFSEILLCVYLLKDEEKVNNKMVLPVLIPSLLIQILGVPYPVESFYWYVGGINYTFAFSLSLVLLYLFLRLKEGNMRKGKTIFGGCSGGYWHLSLAEIIIRQAFHQHVFL